MEQSAIMETDNQLAAHVNFSTIKKTQSKIIQAGVNYSKPFLLDLSYATVLDSEKYGPYHIAIWEGTKSPLKNPDRAPIYKANVPASSSTNRVQLQTPFNLTSGDYIVGLVLQPES